MTKSQPYPFALTTFQLKRNPQIRYTELKHPIAIEGAAVRGDLVVGLCWCVCMYMAWHREAAYYLGREVCSTDLS